MKKFILITVLSVLIAFTANAQLRIGAKAGFNYSTITNLNNVDIPSVNEVISGIGDNAYRFGYNLGVFVNINLPVVLLSFQPELQYSRQGAKNTGTIAGTNESYTSNIILDYINVPLMFQVYVVPRILNLEIGPQLGFLLNSQQRAESGFFNKDPKVSIDNISGFDFSLALGAGIKVPLIPLGLSVRYVLGLTNTYKDINSTANSSRTSNGVLQVGLFFRL